MWIASSIGWLIVDTIRRDKILPPLRVPRVEAITCIWCLPNGDNFFAADPIAIATTTTAAAAATPLSQKLNWSQTVPEEAMIQYSYRQTVG
jgi:hypothetical protein